MRIGVVGVTQEYAWITPVVSFGGEFWFSNICWNAGEKEKDEMGMRFRLGCAVEFGCQAAA
jgi:hypothetical protein